MSGEVRGITIRCAAKATHDIFKGVLDRCARMLEIRVLRGDKSAALVRRGRRLHLN
jgi:hypothetical protein